MHFPIYKRLTTKTNKIFKILALLQAHTVLITVQAAILMHSESPNYSLAQLQQTNDDKCLIVLTHRV